MVAVPQMQVLDALVAAAPPIIGAEYRTPDVLSTLWADQHGALGIDMGAAKEALQAFLKSRHPAWNAAGRVHFNLAENRKAPTRPSRLCRPIPRLSAHGKAQHLPLSQALAEFSEAWRRRLILTRKTWR